MFLKVLNDNTTKYQTAKCDSYMIHYNCNRKKILYEIEKFQLAAARLKR